MTLFTTAMPHRSLRPSRRARLCGCLHEQRCRPAGRRARVARECAGVRGAGCRGRFSHYIARTLRLCHSRAVCLRRGCGCWPRWGCDTLVFGAEDPDTAQLSQVAELLARPELDALLRERLSTGMTYAAARAEAADALLPGAGTLLRTPNNILGIEYCKAILAQGAALTPLALPRLGAAHGGRQAGGAQWHPHGQRQLPGAA